MTDKYSHLKRKWRLENRDKIKASQKRYALKNRKTIIAKARAWNLANPGRVRMHNRKRNLKRHFGVTVDQYVELLKTQKGRCAICGTAKVKRKLAVDHCHATRKIRGLLCTSCNIGLGYFKDSSALLQAAAVYLNG